MGLLDRTLAQLVQYKEIEIVYQTLRETVTYIRSIQDKYLLCEKNKKQFIVNLDYVVKICLPENG
ncbi:MAG: hypothetical protein ABFD50_04575 [Smithella sp.]